METKQELDLITLIEKCLKAIEDLGLEKAERDEPNYCVKAYRVGKIIRIDIEKKL